MHTRTRTSFDPHWRQPTWDGTGAPPRREPIWLNAVDKFDEALQTGVESNTGSHAWALRSPADAPSRKPRARTGAFSMAGLTVGLGTAAAVLTLAPLGVLAWLGTSIVLAGCMVGVLTHNR